MTLSLVFKTFKQLNLMKRWIFLFNDAFICHNNISFYNSTVITLWWVKTLIILVLAMCYLKLKKTSLIPSRSRYSNFFWTSAHFFFHQIFLNFFVVAWLFFDDSLWKFPLNFCWLLKMIFLASSLRGFLFPNTHST